MLLTTIARQGRFWEGTGLGWHEAGLLVGVVRRGWVLGEGGAGEGVWADGGGYTPVVVAPGGVAEPAGGVAALTNSSAHGFKSRSGIPGRAAVVR